MKSLFVTLYLLVAIGSAKAQKSEIFAPAGKAIKGYDPVAFFTQSKPVMGADSLSFAYKGANWLFSSTENLKKFKASPGKYEPQYGGYCAYGMADGHKAPTQTETWTVTDGKLYFNYNLKVKEMWNKNQPAFIEKANAQWPGLKDKP
ncbi:YHS domain-containing (seleno)protein [Pedobacter sp. Du54]|uniref:YHS domain-containing (seleno)protein n=1 Tax=Pedobacter anseongensis TaxID=3133439 RepID=UPI0030B1D329